MVQFLAVGLVVFAANALFGSRTEPAAAPTPGAESPIIEVDARQIDELRETYRVLWNRPPTVTELRELIEEKVREEVLYRHAIELGLDRDDLVVRRRLIQRVRFLTQDLAMIGEVDEATLQAHLEAHADYFADPPRVAFDQLAFGNAAGEEKTPEAAAAALQRLQEAPADAALPTDLASEVKSYPLMTEREIAESFGSSFAEAVMGFASGSWHGPIVSRDAFHLVRITRREPSQVPPLAEIRDRVRRDYEAEKREQANEAYYQDLRQRFQVVIDEAALAAPTTPSGTEP